MASALSPVLSQLPQGRPWVSLIPCDLPRSWALASNADCVTTVESGLPVTPGLDLIQYQCHFFLNRPTDTSHTCLCSLEQSCPWSCTMLWVHRPPYAPYACRCQAVFGSYVSITGNFHNLIQDTWHLVLKVLSQVERKRK